MRIKYSFILILFSALSELSYSQNKIISFNNPDIFYEGRIKYNSDAAELSWSGTSVTVMVKGTTISAILKDSDTADYYNVIIDGKPISKIHADTTKHSYLLATGLSNKKHKVQLFKRTEWSLGKTLFYGFETSESTVILPQSSKPKRRIEFYGNSITCGYAMEDYSENDSWHGFFENNYLSYAAITARHFNAQYSCISRSGIGIMVSWFPLIMPEMYDRLDATDSTSKWDFASYIPDIVVINLFQNDSWIVGMPKNEQFKYRFDTQAPDEKFTVSAYKSFVTSIRSKYPNASIICALGNMDATKTGSRWPGYIQQAVDQLHDSKIYTHFFEYKNTAGHPKVTEQQDMAESLIKFINHTVKW